MKIIILLCFFSGLAQSSQIKNNCDLNCDPKDYKALVTCNANTNVCTCKKPEDGACPDDFTLPSGPLTWNACHNLARDEAAKFNPDQIKFFRWEDMEIDVEGETDKQTLQLCYLLPAPCTGLSPGDCYPYDDAPCVAGPSDMECEPENTVFCEAPEWNYGGLHWICVGPKNHVVNAYTSPGTSIPKGTTCDTGKIECSTWEWDDGQSHGGKKIATVKCAETEKAPGVGIWESNPADNMLKDNEPVAEDGSTIEAYQILPHLNDAVCRCPLLEITEITYNTPGLSLLCDQPYNPEDLGIKYGNACTLLCDGHFKMYIECIKGQWKNTGDGYPFDEVTKEDINC